MSDALYIAVDLGAGSGRVFLGGVAPGELFLEEVRRFTYPPAYRDGHLRWDFARIVGEVESGLRAAAERARALGRRVTSLGVDSWAVDYGLLDREGRLLEDPICYRDDRTRDAIEEVGAVVPLEEIFARTGIQFLAFNTLYQLHAHVREGLPGTADRLLLIPDLIHFHLTGRAVAEATNASTTQLLAAGTGRWDLELMHRLGIPARLFADVVPAGTDLGPLRAELADALGLEGVRVVAPATHDTASAVLGTPLSDGWAFVSSGTWSLVGVERDTPLLGAAALRCNVTNEGGAFGSVRLLKNVMGLWILESCRRAWEAQGLDVDYERLLEASEHVASRPSIDPDDPRLLNPASMLAALEAQLDARGERLPAEPAAVTRMVLESLGRRTAGVLRELETLTGSRIHGVHVVGGGSRNRVLNRAIARSAGLPVLAGPVEATVVGNVLAQAMAAGRFGSVAEARAHVAANVALERVEAR